MHQNIQSGDVIAWPTNLGQYRSIHASPSCEIRSVELIVMKYLPQTTQLERVIMIRL
jgi:hypothetical protein